MSMGLLVIAGCGVDVPDDVADDIEDARDASTTEPPTSTTEAPTSDDHLEQALIDNGYTLAEARCGATNLREVLTDEEIAEIVAADFVDDIDPDLADSFADALQPCVEDGAGSAGPPDDEDGGG